MPPVRQIQALKKLSRSQKLVVISLSVVMDQVQSLPKRDRDDFLSLMQALKEAPDQEERDSLQAAMEEILAQTPVTVEEFDLSAAPTPSAFARHVGKVLKGLREKSGLTQHQLAEKSGLLQSHISRIERGEYSPTNKTLTKLAAALGVPIGALDPSDCPTGGELC